MHHMCRTRPGGPRDRGRTLMLSMRRDWQLNRHRSACARLLGGAGGWREVSAAARRRESSNTTHHAHRRGPLAVAIAGLPFGRGPLCGGGECGGRQCSAVTFAECGCTRRRVDASGLCPFVANAQALESRSERSGGHASSFVITVRRSHLKAILPSVCATMSEQQSARPCDG